MVITNKFIDENRSERGGWTKLQLKAIGVDWPPKKGWKQKVIGRGINDDQARRFMRNKNSQLSLFPKEKIDSN